jgi:hypothetical protein
MRRPNACSRPRAARLPVKLHAEQLSDQGGAALVARYGGLSADHLEHLSPQGAPRWRAPARWRCCCPAPTTSCARRHAAAGAAARGRRAAGGGHRLQSRHLAHDFAAAGDEHGLHPVAPDAAGSAARLHRQRGARAGPADIGTLEAGKRADFALWDIARPADLAYAIGANPCRAVVNGGVLREPRVNLPPEDGYHGVAGRLIRRHHDMEAYAQVCLAGAGVDRLLPAGRGFGRRGMQVGSKRFTESYILGEILAQTAAPVARVEHRQGLGNTAIVLSALRSGAIDVYPEYLGTIDLEILKNPQADHAGADARGAAPARPGRGVPLGFSNGYALATRGDAGIHAVRHWPQSRRSSWGCRTNSSAAPTAGRAWPRATACRRRRAASTTASPTRPCSSARSTSSTSIRPTPRSASTACACWTTTGIISRATTPCCCTGSTCRSACRRPGARCRVSKGASADAMIAMNAQAELEGRPFAAIAPRLAGRQRATRRTSRRRATACWPRPSATALRSWRASTWCWCWPRCCSAAWPASRWACWRRWRRACASRCWRWRACCRPCPRWPCWRS